MQSRSYSGAIRKVLLGTAASTLAAVGSTIGTAQAQSVYSFGDSLSDTGNVNTITFGAVPNNDYFGGRFSNGFIWVDYINAWYANNSQRLNPLLVDPFASTTRGYNFAHGGSISARNGINFGSIFGNGALGALQLVPAFRLDRQARHFRDERSFFFLDSFRAGADDFATISIGGNDYINGERDVNFVVNSTITSLNYIRQGGIQNFFVLALPNLGLVPQEAGGANSGVLSTLSAQHNSLLDVRINSFEQQTGTQIAFVRLDRLFDFITWDADNNNGAILGFNVVRAGPGTTGHCLGDGLVLGACPDSYLSYDGLHPTRSGHFVIAQLATATFQSVQAANTSSIASTQSISRQATSDNRVISARLNAARLGVTSSGTFSNTISSGVAGFADAAGLGFQKAGEAPSGSQRLSFYRYADGLAPEYSNVTPGNEFSPENLSFSLNLDREEYVSSYGIDYLTSNNFVFGGLYSRAALNQDAFNVFRSDEVTNFSVYSAWFNGPWTASLTAQVSDSEQFYVRDSGLRFLAPIENEISSLATTTRLETSWAGNIGKTRVAATSRASFTRVDHDGYRETSQFGLIDTVVDQKTEAGAAAYFGASVARDMRLGNHINATVNMEAGGLVGSSLEIGFAPVLDDSALLRDDIGSYGFRDAYRGTAREGGYLSFGVDVAAHDRLSLSAQASAVTTNQGTSPVARISATYRF